jgi:hypothetical protein
MLEAELAKSAFSFSFALAFTFNEGVGGSMSLGDGMWVGLDASIGWERERDGWGSAGERGNVWQGGPGIGRELLEMKKLAGRIVAQMWGFVVASAFLVVRWEFGVSSGQT